MKKIISSIILLIATTSTVVAASSYQISHLEPANWWVNMKSEQLQLLVHGKDIADLTPTINHQNVQLIKVNRVDNPNYLFLDLVIKKNTKPQTINIEFFKGKKLTLSHQYPLLARNKVSQADKSYSGKDVIYLVTPDRFSNGDLSNDVADTMIEGLNRSHPYGRHGGDLAGVIKHLDYISEMGFTQLWLNPVMENNQVEQSYHGYGITDFYQVDPRYGTNEQYKQLSIKAAEKGIGLIKDVILNHGGLNHWWRNDMPMADWYNFQGKPYQGTNHARETMQDPYAAESDKQLFADGWFVPAMPDLNQRNPFMANYLIQNAIWWVEYANLSGIRVDTLPYSDKAFVAKWSERLTEEYPNINIVGEEWTTNPAIVAYWQRGKQNHDGYSTDFPSVMDFPLQNALVNALKNKDSWNTGLGELYRMLANDFLYADASNLVIFPDNHDMSRIFTQLDEDYALYKMAMTFMATSRGIPQIYYGTEILMSNKGTESHGVIRTDFPGGWPGDKKSAFTGKGLSKQQLDAQQFVKKLLNWRKSATAIHHGKLTHYSPHDGMYVYFRYTDTQKVMVVLNKSDKEKTIKQADYLEMLSGATSVTNVLSNKQTRLADSISIPAKSSAIFEVH